MYREDPGVPVGTCQRRGGDVSARFVPITARRKPVGPERRVGDDGVKGVRSQARPGVGRETARGELVGSLVMSTAGPRGWLEPGARLESN